MNRHDQAGDASPLPTGIEDPSPFFEPWQAQAFALVVGLHEQGVFSWHEWAQSLSTELKKPGAAQDGSDYYRCWLIALEKLLDQKKIAGSGEVEQVAAAWSRAAHATPHGQPILLENDPHSGSG